MNDRLFCQIPRPKIGIRVVVDGRCNGVREKTKKNLSQSYGRWIVGFDETMTSAFLRSKRALGLEVLDERRTYTAEGKISARGRTEAPAQGAGRKATGGRSDPRQMEWTAALLG